MSPAESNSEYDIQISADAEPFPLEPERLRALIENTLPQFAVSKAAVDIAVVSDSEIAELHQQYFGNREVTDVISFDLSDDRQPGRCFSILVNAEQAARQAAQRGHAPQAELALYIVHGLLHQLGYDDNTPEEAERMHRMEDQILERNGCGAVYYRTSQ